VADYHVKGPLMKLTVRRDTILEAIVTQIRCVGDQCWVVKLNCLIILSFSIIVHSAILYMLIIQIASYCILSSFITCYPKVGPAAPYR
jgi:hypothetical protein